MMTRRTPLTALVLCGAMILPLIACSSTPQENEAAVCDAYTSLVGSVSEARASLSTSSTIAEISDARDSIRSSYQELQDSLAKVGEDRAADLETAWDTFTKAVDDIDTDSTVPEAAASLTDELADIESAQLKFDEALSCG